MRATHWFTVVTLALMPLAAGAGAQRPDNTSRVVDLAGAYVTEFVMRFASVVADETYVQERTTRSGARRKREITSDLLFVRLPETSDWLVFRDVRTVDGRPVRAGEGDGNRLVELLTSPSTGARDRATALTQDSARFSLPEWPTINNPLLVLSFLQDAYRMRFRFTGDNPAMKFDGDDVAVRFEERTRPTLLRAGKDDLVAAGRFWADPQSGQLSRTQLLMRNVTVWTTFARDERLQIDVPMQMTESYFDLRSGDSLRGTASYANFRTFQVSTGQSFR